MGYSPILAIVTGSLEIAAAVFFIIKIRKNINSSGLIIIILFLLAGYQILEALNCSSMFYGRLTRLAFTDITWLPAISLFYIAKQQKKQMFRNISYIYLIMALLFSIWYMLITESLALSHCRNVIALYYTHNPMYAIYSIYYQSGLLLMILIPAIVTSTLSDVKHQKNLRDFQIGVIAFVIPSIITGLITWIHPHSMPSIMCHFAVLLAVFLVRILHRETLSEKS